MSRSHNPFGDGPSRSDTPPSSSVPTPPNHALIEARQQALREARARFRHNVAAYRQQPDPQGPLAEPIREDYRRFITGHVHRMLWDELWDFVEALSLIRIRIPTLYILGGWCTPALPDAAALPVQRPSEDLLQDLELHAVFAEARAFSI